MGPSTSPARAWPQWRDVMTHSAMTFVGAAAFPGLAYRLRWPTRLGPRGLVAYIAFNTAFLFALRTWFLPELGRRIEAFERAKAEATERLGREPTDAEMMEQWARNDRGL